jgi:hypothetical protein
MNNDTELTPVITECTFKWLNPNEGETTVALGYVVFNGLFKMDFILLEGKYGPFVNFGSKRKDKKSNKWFCTASITDKEKYNMIKDEIVKLYVKHVTSSSELDQ